MPITAKHAAVNHAIIWSTEKTRASTRTSITPSTRNLIPVRVALERTLGLHADVVRLLLGELRQLCAQGGQVQARDLLVQGLRQQVDVVLVGLGLLPVLQQVQLAQHLVGEGARHDKGGVPGGAAEIQEAAR